MNFKTTNAIDRAFYRKDFSDMEKLLKRIRSSLITGSEIKIDDLNLNSIVEYIPNETITYIYLFQEGKNYIRWGSTRASFSASLKRNIEKLRQNKAFNDFRLEDENTCRILLEYSFDRKQVDIKNITSKEFNKNRFEIGITGIELKDKNTNKSYYYMPQVAITQSHLEFKRALKYLLLKTPIVKLTTDTNERLKIFFDSNDYNTYFFRSRAFVTYKDKCIPLYRGNMLFPKFSLKFTKELIINTSNYMVEYQEPDGKFLYYYDCKNDSRLDHEHPLRKEPDLYYNEIRHAGGIIALLRTYEFFKKDKRYLKSAKSALEWNLTITKSHNTKYGKGFYAFLNDKAKLGSVGLFLASFIYYRRITKDKSYDEYIKGYVRHILDRVEDTGEFLQYYINPDIQKGKPLYNLTKDEKIAAYQFYYPGEALLGLALFAKYFKDDSHLEALATEISKKALDYMVDIRPKEYAQLFPSLPSDAWLMQAVCEWSSIYDMDRDNWKEFVYKDAQTLIDKMYKKDDSPYIDYEGGFYYDYGDHYYPDGARSEGLIAGYNLAKKKKDYDFAKKILSACKKAAKNQYQVYNTKEYTYSHKNPKKAYRAVRLKATRQWTRVDMAWHVSMFFVNLYLALKNEKNEKK